MEQCSCIRTSSQVIIKESEIFEFALKGYPSPFSSPPSPSPFFLYPLSLPTLVFRILTCNSCITCKFEHADLRIVSASCPPVRTLHSFLRLAFSQTRIHLKVVKISKAIRAKPIEFEKFKNECTDELGDG